MSNNKNGYELRTEILAIAKDSVWNAYYAEQNIWTETNKDCPARSHSTPPKIPTSQDILDAAHMLYKFVDGRPAT